MDRLEIKIRQIHVGEHQYVDGENILPFRAYRNCLIRPLSKGTAITLPALEGLTAVLVIGVSFSSLRSFHNH